MPNKNYDYIKWGAVSTKESIKQRLAENPIFTDYVFEDSNLTTLIDVFSYTFDALSYYINHGASEAIFSDAVLYENINRMVKMLNYNPQGHSSAGTEVIFATVGQDPNTTTGTLLENNDATDIIQIVLPKYTSVNTNKVDENGATVYYSLIDSRFITPDSNGILSNSDADTSSIMINGKWTLYPETFIADGTAFQSFNLNQLNVFEDTTIPYDYISHPYIDVYVKNANDEYVQYTALPEGTLFNTNSTLVSADDNVFQIRLDENYNYVLTFGDGIHGTRLDSNDEVYVVYLNGNGKEGEIPVNLLGPNNNIEQNISGMRDEVYKSIIESTGVDADANESLDLTNLYVNNITTSTTYAGPEDVDSIKQNAPDFFRQGDRLINDIDYKRYTLMQFRNDIYDVYPMNNYEYLATFLNWLRVYGVLSNDIREADYINADPCDFNNIYLWTKYKGYKISSAIVENELYKRKGLTSEPLVTDALAVYMVPSLVNNSYTIDEWDPCVENWIEIEKDPNSIISADRIKQTALAVYRDFFSDDKLKIGATLTLSDLQTQLESIEGVKSIKTIYLSKEDQDNEDFQNKQQFNGLKFASWTVDFVSGADLEFVSGSKTINNFQFIQSLNDDDLQLEKRIKVKYSTVGGQYIEY